MRAQLSQLKQVIGMFIKSTTNGPTSKVYSFGSNINKLRAALGGGTLRNHNSFGPLVVLVGTSSETTFAEACHTSPRLVREPVQPGQHHIPASVRSREDETPPGDHPRPPD
jgi:hypothetical protein